MKKLNFNLFLILCLLSSCQTAEIQNASFEGEFYAKNVISVQCDFPDISENTNYSWFVGSSSDGEWQKLQGIWTNEIVLLTSHVDKYIKCEISCKVKNSDDQLSVSLISSQPVKLKGNKNTDWFHNVGFGIMVHYLKPTIVPDGGSKEWNNAVNSFDVEKFASQASDAGAGFVMFTLGQNSGYYCSPNKVFENVVGVNPGDLCSTRDLPMDLINALKKYEIPLILYLPSNPPVNNKLVSEKFHYPLKDTATSQYNQPILEDMIREWSLRYG